MARERHGQTEGLQDARSFLYKSTAPDFGAGIRTLQDAANSHVSIVIKAIQMLYFASGKQFHKHRIQRVSPVGNTTVSQGYSSKVAGFRDFSPDWVCCYPLKGSPKK